VENSKDFCHMCGLCQKNCPSRIETTSILRYLAYYEGYNKTKLAKESYSFLKPEQTSTACQNCGECEKVCPYGVSVRKKIRETHLLLG
jgi:predicted aldo/keto reductase-like oxidoreductase